MGGEVLIFSCIFLVIFGIAYLHYSTRNKERLALIEKGADASIFVKGKRERAAPIWKILVLNIALLAMGIGAGVVIGGIIEHSINSGIQYDDSQGRQGRIDFVMPGTIFLLAGTGLLIGFFLTKKLDQET